VVATKYNHELAVVMAAENYENLTEQKQTKQAPSALKVR
jgi:hypothetical protein